MAAFTLIETIIVLGILSSILALGIFMGIDSYRSMALEMERSILLSLLIHARAEAMNNVDGAAHGVCIDKITRSYSGFAKKAYAYAFEIHQPESTSLIVAGLPDCTESGIIFSRYAGTTTDASIQMGNGLKTVGIAITSSGTITAE